jgi:hypothetical protein
VVTTVMEEPAAAVFRIEKVNLVDGCSRFL